MRDEPLIGPWRVQPAVGALEGSSELPGVLIMDYELDLVWHSRATQPGADVVALQAGRKCRYPDGRTIKTHGAYTPEGGDGRGRRRPCLVMGAPNPTANTDTNTDTLDRQGGPSCSCWTGTVRASSICWSV